MFICKRAICRPFCYPRDGLVAAGRACCNRGLLQISRHLASNKGVDLTGYDESQTEQLEDRCILVDDQDRIIGSASKIDCHLAKNKSHEVGHDSPGGLLHRAFSVFLFNSKNELLLQQRSKFKISYPEYYTNTCCSHPRASNVEMNDLEHIGVKIAAQRRLNFELGVPMGQISINDIFAITRVHYNAPAGDVWAENEVDHILMVKKDVDLSINQKEVAYVRYVNEEGLHDFMKDAEVDGYRITPWFKFIYKAFLSRVWKDVKAGKNFEELRDDKIWRAGDIY